MMVPPPVRFSPTMDLSAFGFPFGALRRRLPGTRLAGAGLALGLLRHVLAHPLRVGVGLGGDLGRPVGDVAGQGGTLEGGLGRLLEAIARMVGAGLAVGHLAALAHAGSMDQSGNAEKGCPRPQAGPSDAREDGPAGTTSEHRSHGTGCRVR